MEPAEVEEPHPDEALFDEPRLGQKLPKNSGEEVEGNTKGLDTNGIEEEDKVKNDLTSDGIVNGEESFGPGNDSVKALEE